MLWRPCSGSERSTAAGSRRNVWLVAIHGTRAATTRCPSPLGIPSLAAQSEDPGASLLITTQPGRPMGRPPARITHISNNPRIYIWGALALVVFLNYQAWMTDYGPKP